MTITWNNKEITITTYYEAVQYFKMRMERCGYKFDFIDNPVTCNQFIVINGHRAKVENVGACTPIETMFKYIQDACKRAWQDFKR